VRRIGLLGIATLLVAAPAAAGQTPPAPPAATAPVSGSVIMDGSWEGAIQPRRGELPRQWLGLQVKPGRTICFTLRCSRYALKLVGSPVRDGAKAGRFEVRDGDNPFGDAERAEVQAAPTGRAGTLRWYTWSTYLPPTFRWAGANNERDLILTQWAVARGSAPVGIYVSKDLLTLQVNEQANPKRFLAVHRPWGTPIRPLIGRWVDFAMLVRWSASGSGQIQLWVDGVQQQMNYPFGDPDPNRHGGVGAYAFAGRTLVPGGGPTYVRQGIARSARLSGRTVVMHDALKTYSTRTPVPVPPTPPPAPPAP
jgi:hypothetical protein